MARLQRNFIIDFDSTFIKVEAFDELCKLCYEDEAERAAILEKVKGITDQGMSGELSITQSLRSRLLLMNAHKRHLAPLVAVLRNQVSESFKKNETFLEENSDQIYIVSNGFYEFILPVVLEYGIKPEQVFANSFRFDAAGNITGFDQENVLASAQGKVKLVSDLNLKGEIVVIGDGYTDYEIMEAGVASRFYAFVENVRRENVVCKTEYVVSSFDHVIADFASAKGEFELNKQLKKSV